MPIKSYRYYLFDIDRTLWDFDRNSEHAIKELVLRHPLVTDKTASTPEALHTFYLRYDEINMHYWDLFEQGKVSKDVLRWKRFYDCLLLYGIDSENFAKQLWDEYLEQMAHEKELVPGALELLTALQRSGAKMAVLSNGFKEIQYGKLERSGIRHFFDQVIISEEVGYRKPSTDIFRVALERLSGLSFSDDPNSWKSAKRSTLMIGDDFTLDIEGAQIFGIDQYFFNPKGLDFPGATYEGKDLTEIIPR